MGGPITEGYGDADEAPEAPAAPVAVAGEALASLTWLAPEDNGSPITGYMVTTYPGGGVTILGAGLSADITSLTAGVDYCFTIQAVNEFGASQQSSPSNSVTPPIYIGDGSNWSDAEDAIRVAVKTAAGFADSQVIWANQNGPQPGGDYITLLMGGTLALGIDADPHDYSSGGDAGQEITLQVLGNREFTLTAQGFTASTVGASAARALMSKVQTRLSLGSIREGLGEAGLSCFDSGSVSYVPGIKGTGFEGRAVWTSRWYLLESASELTGYIASMEDPSTLDDTDF